MNIRRSVAGLLVVFSTAGISGCDWVQMHALKTYMAFNQNLTTADGAKYYESALTTFTARAVAEGFEFPWDIHFIGATELLLTEKPGRLWRIDIASGAKQPISGLPDSVMHGQGGLLGVVAHPDFQDNRRIYLSYSIETAKGHWTTQLASARLGADTLTDLRILFTATPATASGNHFGGALIFDQQGYLYLSVGDRGDRHQAQRLESALGKIFRFQEDGEAPADNPFVHTSGALPGIWSYGHRNPQGLSIDPASGALWESEHGPQGGDEINLIRRGANYGWPVITYGEEYGGGKIGRFEHPEMEQPVHYYIPSIATAGLLYYNSPLFPQWRDSIFVAGLRATSVSRVSVAGGAAQGDERLFEDLTMRIRSLEAGPDGSIYVLTENGILFQLLPAATR